MSEMSLYFGLDELITRIETAERVLRAFPWTGMPAVRASDLLPLVELQESVLKLSGQVEDEELGEAIEAWSASFAGQIEINEQLLQWLARSKGHAVVNNADRIRLYHELKQDLTQGSVGWIDKPEYEAFDRMMAGELVRELSALRSVKQRLCQLVVQSLSDPATVPVVVVAEVAVFLATVLSDLQSLRMPDILRTEFHPSLHRALVKIQELTNAYWDSGYREGLTGIERWFPMIEKADDRMVQWLAQKYGIDLAQDNGRTILHERNLEEFRSRAATGLRSLAEIWMEDNFQDLAVNGHRMVDRLHDARRLIYDARAAQEDRALSVQEQIRAASRTPAAEVVARRPVYLTVEIVTFADLWQHGPVIVEFIERVWHSILPRPIRLRTTHWPKEQYMPKPARHSIVTPGSPKWLALRDLLLQGQLGGLFIQDWEVPLKERTTPLWRPLISVDFGSQVLGSQMRGQAVAEYGTFEPREAKVLKMEVDTAFWGGIISDELQERIVRLAEVLFERLDAACGYIDLSHGRDTYLTSYEQRIGMVNPNGSGLWRNLRGAFWGNFLSWHHVELLGGREAVRSSAPCWQVREVSTSVPANDRTGLYLQLTERLDTATAEDYHGLERFLTPILPSGPARHGGCVITQVLLGQLGSPEDLRLLLQPSGLVATWLPDGSLLVEYASQAGFQAVLIILQRAHSVGTPYRSIPPIRKLDDYDVIVVWTLTKQVTKRPKNTSPVYPLVVVQPYILTDEIEFEVVFEEPATDGAAQELGRLVSQWSRLTYEFPAGDSVISGAEELTSATDKYIWRANLAPVGQAAYVQLIMMLDAFSITTSRLAEVHVRPAD